MIEIDGSFGEGGGQIIRTALGLSLATGKSFTISNIRSKRRNPGLLRQHLTAVNAAVSVGKANVQGNEINSKEIVFEPTGIFPGKYLFDIGSAGSASLVMQTVLPALAFAKEESEITIIGGTHNPMAPPFDFVKETFFPVLQKMGLGCNFELEAYGFYPAGGGRVRVTMGAPTRIQPIHILDRGPILSVNLEGILLMAAFLTT